MLHGPRDSRKRTASAHRVTRERRAWYPFAASQTRPSPRPLPAWFANRLQFCLPHREGTRLENLGAGTSRRSPYRVPGFADAALSPTEVSEGVSPQDHSRSGERQKANLCCLLVLPTPSPPPSLRGHDEQRPRALVSPSHTRVEHSRDHSTGS